MDYKLLLVICCQLFVPSNSDIDFCIKMKSVFEFGGTNN